MPGVAPTVYLVDDDPDLLGAMQRLLESVGIHVSAFQSAQEFLRVHDRLAPGCLVLDLAMPGLNGLQLQRELEQRAIALPIIFLTGRGDIATSVQAMKHGATDFLTKPVDDFVLLAAIKEALETDRLRRRTQVERDRIAECLARLTERERQVLAHVISGRLNKQIAADLGTVEKTIKFHRGNLMRKMGVRSVAELVKLTERVGIGAALGR
jgi:FixJ family two-component response regulator